MTDMHACHLSTTLLAAPEPAAHRPSFLTGRAAQWIGFVMLCEVLGLIILHSLR